MEHCLGADPCRGRRASEAMVREDFLDTGDIHQCRCFAAKFMPG